jgi:hypothetical protein
MWLLSSFFLLIENEFNFWSKLSVSSKGTCWAPLCVYFIVIHWSHILCNRRFTIWHCRFVEYAHYESENSEKRNARYRLQISQDNRMLLMLLLYNIKVTLFFSSEKWTLQCLLVAHAQRSFFVVVFYSFSKLMPNLIYSFHALFLQAVAFTNKCIQQVLKLYFRFCTYKSHFCVTLFFRGKQ